MVCTEYLHAGEIEMFVHIPLFVSLTPFFWTVFGSSRYLSIILVRKKPLLLQKVIDIVESIPPFFGQYSYFLHSQSLLKRHLYAILRAWSCSPIFLSYAAL